MASPGFVNVSKFVFANLNPHQKTLGNNFIHQNRANSPNNLSPLKKTVGFLLVNISPKFHKNDRAHKREEQPQCQLWSPSQPSPGGIIRTSHSLFIFACDVSPILPISHNVNTRWVTWWDLPLGQKCVCVFVSHFVMAFVVARAVEYGLAIDANPHPLVDNATRVLRFPHSAHCLCHRCLAPTSVISSCP